MRPIRASHGPLQARAQNHQIVIREEVDPATDDSASVVVQPFGSLADHKKIIASSSSSSSCNNNNSSSAVRALAVSPDGRYVASCGDSGKIFVYDGHHQRLRTTLEHSSSSNNNRICCLCLCFSPDGKMLASGGKDGCVRIFDVVYFHSPARACMRTFQQQQQQKQQQCSSSSSSCSGGRSIDDDAEDGVLALAWSPDSKTIAIGIGNGIALFDVVLAKPKANSFLTGHAGPVTSLVFSKDGSTLFSGSFDRRIRCWSLLLSSSSSKKLQPENTTTAGSMLSSSTSSSLSTSSPSSATPKSVVKGHAGTVSCLDISADGKFLLSASHDNTCRVWSITTSVASSSSSSSEKTVQPEEAVPTVTLKQLACLVGHAHWVRAARFFVPSSSSSSSSSDHTKFSSSTSSPSRKRANSSSMNNNNSIVASCSSDGTIRFWCFETGRQLLFQQQPTKDGGGGGGGPLYAHATAEINDIAFSSSPQHDGGTTLYSASSDGTVGVMDVVAGTIRQQMEIAAPVSSLEFSSDGRFLVVKDLFSNPTQFPVRRGGSDQNNDAGGGGDFSSSSSSSSSSSKKYAWMNSSGLALQPETKRILIEEGIDQPALKSLTEADLKELRIRMGDRKKLSAMIIQRPSSSCSSGVTAAAAASAQHRDDGDDSIIAPAADDDDDDDGDDFFSGSDSNPESPTALIAAAQFPKNFVFSANEITLSGCLGTGGSGAVYQAVIRSIGRKVAAKVFRHPDAIKDSIEECKGSLKLQHPNIVNTIGVCLAKSAFTTDLILLLELSTEGTLHNLMRRRKMMKYPSGATATATTARRTQQQQQQSTKPVATTTATATAPASAPPSSMMSQEEESFHLSSSDDDDADEGEEEGNAAQQAQQQQTSSEQQQGSMGAPSSSSAATATNNNNSNDPNSDDDTLLAELPFDLVECYIRQVTEGVAYLHSQSPKIVHCDIKMSNVLLFNSVCKVCDFGLMRRTLETTCNINMTRGAAGTLRFMPPETIRDAVTSTRSDVYSLGAGIILPLICARLPFCGMNEMQILQGRLIDHFPPPRQGCPETLVRICRQCIDPDPMKRPRDAVQVLQMLLGENERLPVSISSQLRPAHPHFPEHHHQQQQHVISSSSSSTSANEEFTLSSSSGSSPSSRQQRTSSSPAPTASVVGSQPHQNTTARISQTMATATSMGRQEEEEEEGFAVVDRIASGDVSRTEQFIAQMSSSMRG